MTRATLQLERDPADLLGAWLDVAAEHTAPGKDQLTMQNVHYYAKTDLDINGQHYPAGTPVAVLQIPDGADPKRIVRGIASGKLDPNEPAEPADAPDRPNHPAGSEPGSEAGD